jgi:hypothetical protein
MEITTPTMIVRGMLFNGFIAPVPPLLFCRSGPQVVASTQRMAIRL